MLFNFIQLSVKNESQGKVEEFLYLEQTIQYSTRKYVKFEMGRILQNKFESGKMIVNSN
jgi:hypothetical protein